MTRVMVGLSLLVSVGAVGCDRRTATMTEERSSITGEDGNPAPGAVHGAALSVAEVTPLDRILANPGAFQGKLIRTAGTVRAVCQHRGCWFDIGAAEESGGRLHVRSVDHSVSIPRDAVGKQAEVEGEIQELPGSSSCGGHVEQHAEGPGTSQPECGVAAAGRVAQLALRGAVLR